MRLLRRRSLRQRGCRRDARRETIRRRTVRLQRRHGSSSGGMVGHTAVQVAARRGAHVLATAGPTFAAQLEGFGAAVTPYGDGTVDHVLDASRPAAGAIAALVEIAGDPRRVVTISNHDEARTQGARVNVDELLARGTVPTSEFLPGYAALVATGGLTVPIARTFPLEQWRAAAELSPSAAPHGKVVLIP